MMRKRRRRMRKQVLTALLPRAVLLQCPTVTMPWKEAATQICFPHQQAVLLLIPLLNLTLLRLQLLLLLSLQKWLSPLGMVIQLFSLVIRMLQHHLTLQYRPVAQGILDSSRMLKYV